MTSRHLAYLDFDQGEDTAGIGSFEAMASVAPERLAALDAEIATVLAWADETFPDGRGALDDGAVWDCDVTTLDEGDARRCTRVLSIGGAPAFCEAFRLAFALDQ